MRREALADCPRGAIVRVGARWGVVATEDGEPLPRHNRHRVVDFWWEGREYVPSFFAVDVLWPKQRT